MDIDDVAIKALRQEIEALRGRVEKLEQEVKALHRAAEFQKKKPTFGSEP